MSLPDSLLTGLIEFWPLNEGTGSVGAGTVNGYDMALTTSDARGAGGVNGLWASGGQGTAALGTATLPAILDLLKNVGDSMTFAVEHSFGAYNSTVDPWVLTASGNYSCTIGSIEGDSGFVFLVAYGVVDPPPADPATYTNVYTGSGVGTGTGLHTFKEAPPFELWGAGAGYVAIMEVTRTSSTVLQTKLFVSNAQNMNTASQTIAYEGLDWVVKIGTNEEKPPLTLRAAVWGRLLTSDEKTAIFTPDSLAGLDELDDTVDPFLDEDGVNVLPFRDPHPLTVGSRHIETAGEQRNTRQVHERIRRKYELVIENATPSVMERVQQAITLTRGCLPLRWRHPTDDAPGPRETAPRWLLVNAAEIEISRTPAGSGGNITLILQEV